MVENIEEQSVMSLQMFQNKKEDNQFQFIFFFSASISFVTWFEANKLFGICKKKDKSHDKRFLMTRKVQATFWKLIDKFMFC